MKIIKYKKRNPGRGVKPEGQERFSDFVCRNLSLLQVHYAVGALAEMLVEMGRDPMDVLERLGVREHLKFEGVRVEDDWELT